MEHTQTKPHTVLQCLVAVFGVCLVFAVMQGIHDNYGIMLNGIIAHTSISYASVSLVIAIGQILYGAGQPFFGMLALKRSNAFVMCCGILLMAVGLIATPFCRAFWSLLIFFGILLPSGTAALCFGIVMGAIAPILGEKRAAAVSGIVQASAGIGDALMSPALQQLTAQHGITVSMNVFSIPILCMLPVAVWLGRQKPRRSPGVSPAERKESLFSILRFAFRDPACWRLLIGFSTCGFHMAIIETHLFSQYLSCGIPGGIASLTLTVYGIATMLGSVAAGFLGQRYRQKTILTLVYCGRVLIALGFILIPKTVPFAFLATALLGLTGDSTVPPTTGIIGSKVGMSRMAIVYGAIFIGHQLGAFASAWLGGLLVHTQLGYSALWIADLCLSLLAAAASFRITPEPDKNSLPGAV